MLQRQKGKAECKGEKEEEKLIILIFKTLTIQAFRVHEDLFKKSLAFSLS